MDAYSYICRCIPGWDGDHCEVNMNECASSPCQGVSQCIDAVNSYSCDCQAGTTGVHCEVDIDECVSAPCKNNAPCVDGRDG